MSTSPSPSQRTRAVLWTIGALFTLIVVIGLLSLVETPDGDPLVKNPDTIIIQIIATAGLVGAAVLPLLVRAQKDAAVAREQVANDHIDAQGNPINLRVDVDDKHNELIALVTDKFDAFQTHTNIQFNGIRSDMRGMRKDIGRNTDANDRNREKLDEHLEESREVWAGVREEVEKLHENIASMEDTQPRPAGNPPQD